jgi:hypothetical protein
VKLSKSQVKELGALLGLSLSESANVSGNHPEERAFKEGKAELARQILQIIVNGG